MTVKELIEELEKFDKDKPVLINVYDPEDRSIDYDEACEVFDPSGNGVPMII